MKKTVLFTAIVMVSLKAIAQQPITTEVAIYRISNTANARFASIYHSFRQEVSKLKGFRNWSTYQDLLSPGTYIDLLDWENWDDAQAASAQVKNGIIYQPFTSAIDGLIYYGDFHSFLSIVNTTNKIKMEQKVIEVVIYQLKAEKVAHYSSLAMAANNFLKTQKGFINRKVLQDHQDNSIFMDLVEWETIEDAASAMKNSQQAPELIPFFEATEKVITFSHYTIYQ
jgi:heme-degrading monooxygenase HmoA